MKGKGGPQWVKTRKSRVVVRYRMASIRPAAKTGRGREQLLRKLNQDKAAHSGPPTQERPLTHRLLFPESHPLSLLLPQLLTKCNRLIFGGCLGRFMTALGPIIYE